MKQVLLTTLQLEDIKSVVQEVFENNFSKLNPPKQEIKNVLLSRKETAKFLCISLPTLNDWTKTGIVKAHRIGNRVLYKELEVIQALNEIKISKSGRGSSC